MSNKITSLLFYDSFTGSAGGGVPYFNGNILDDIGTVIFFETAWNFTEARFIFSAADKTITLNNQVDPRNFNDQGFIDTDNITIVNTISNNGNFTINSISDDGLIITVAESLVNEDAKNCSIHGVTPIAGLDFRFNLIKNNASENYFSLTDNQTQQRFTASGLDASDTTTSIPMVVGTKSFGWLVNDITDANAGSTTECIIKGNGISDYKQKFKIIQAIKKTVPVYLNGLFPNFSDNTIPDLYSGGLKYICSIGTKFNDNSPIINHTGGITSRNGYNSWFGVAPDGARSEYYVHSISYVDNGTSDILNSIDVNKDVLITIVIKSRSGKFTDSTKMAINFSVCPSSESDYVNTQTTLLQNQFIDSVFTHLGASSANGTNFGTGYQAITDCSIVRTSSTTATATFVFSPGSILKSFWKSKSDNDRFYELSAITQDISITETAKSDRATILADFKSALWDKENSTLSGLNRNGNEIFKYPDTGHSHAGSAEGIEGDKFFVRLPFWVDKTATDGISATLKLFSFLIVAQKSGQNDFILEQKIINTLPFQKCLGVQDVSYSDTRGFISPDSDPYNLVFIERDSDYDTSTHASYLAQYGFVLRYEYWQDALSQFQIQGQSAQSDISKSICNITQRWSDYNNNEGWNLVFKMSWVVTGIDEFDNTYETTSPIVVHESGTNVGSWGGIAPDFKNEYFAWDEISEVAGELILSVAKDNKTLIRSTYIGAYALPAGSSSWVGAMTALSSSGNIYSSRVANSETDAESDSPFTATDEDLTATYSFASANVRINIFMSGMTVDHIVIESIFNADIFDALVEDIRFYSSLGVIYNSNSSS